MEVELVINGLVPSEKIIEQVEKACFLGIYSEHSKNITGMIDSIGLTTSYKYENGKLN